MKVRDSNSTLNGCTKVTEMPSGGLEIISDDGSTLFEISLSGNVLSVSGGQFCKHENKTLDDRFSIKPVGSNRIELIKDVYVK